MNDPKFLVALAQLLVSIVAAIWLAIYWNRRSEKRDEYRLLDESYSKLLETYQTNPQFGNRRYTNNYTSAFQDSALQYHYFAMSVHNVMESIFDTYESNIPPAWDHVFSYHTLLHLEWLLTNPEAHEPDYVGHVMSLHKRAA